MSTNAAPRALSLIAAEIRERTETIADVIEIGGLLIEAREGHQLDHGDWLPWLEQEFDFSERTAQNYMAASRFAAKYETVSYLKVTCSALYYLATGDHAPHEIEAVLAVAAQRRVTKDAALDIMLELEVSKEPETDVELE